jgi:polar amino acid transport system ATP-binding protein/sulfate transport system ATP-binding protein
MMQHDLKEVLISVKDVSLSFEDRRTGRMKQILKPINVDVRDIVRPDCVTGQVVGVLGPSGIGKTQFSRILTGLQRPTTGSVSVEGKPVVPGLVGMVAQDYPLFRWRTVRGNLMVALEHSDLTKQGRRDQVTEYLTRFGMSDKADLYPSQLSGGQRQRIAIVRELLCSEHFVVMDEPFTGLDPINKDKVADLIVHVANSNEKNTIFVVAHDIAALVSISDTLWLFGRDRDEHGQPVQGAYVKKTYNLIERDLAWRPGISRTKEFFDFCSEVRTEFDDL